MAPKWERAMGTNQSRVFAHHQGLPVFSPLVLILVGVAPIVLTLACLAVTLTFVVPVVLVLAILLPLALFLTPILQACRFWSGWSWSWVCLAHWCPGLWSWLFQSWLLWPWLCWKWLR